VLAVTSEGVTGPDPEQQKKVGYKIQSAGPERQSDPVWCAEYPGCSCSVSRLKLSALGVLSNGACAFKPMPWTNLYSLTHIHHLPHMLTDKGGAS